MFKTPFPCAILDFNSNVCIKTRQLTTHHQTYPYTRGNQDLFFWILHTPIDEHKNYKMINTLNYFLAHMFSFMHLVLSMHVNIHAIVHDCLPTTSKITSVFNYQLMFKH
jgi:hypothetical protein